MTLCDPRLNARQSLDLAFQVAELMRAADDVAMNVAIVGLGLIGGSIGLAARRARRPASSVYDTDAAAARTGRELGCRRRRPRVARRRRSPTPSWRSSAGPSRELPELVAQSLDGVSRLESIVTDVGSTKARLVGCGRDHPDFVGGHPVCGSEARGVANARADLFDGATWFLTPDAGTDPVAHRTVHGFVSGLGARPVAIDADSHDRLVALTSHLPHALANVLVNQAGARPGRRSRPAGRGRRIVP